MTGITYVVAHPDFRAVKVGYTTEGSNRLQNLGRRGWQPFRTLHVATGELARQVEQAALFEIRFRRLVPQYLTAAEMRLGWTETSSLALITARQTWDVVCEQAGLVLLSPLLGRAPDGRRSNGGVPPRRRPGDTAPYSKLARTQARIERTADSAAKDSQ